MVGMRVPTLHILGRIGRPRCRAPRLACGALSVDLEATGKTEFSQLPRLAGVE
jgi:hypothetical protein